MGAPRLSLLRGLDLDRGRRPALQAAAGAQLLRRQPDAERPAGTRAPQEGAVAAPERSDAMQRHAAPLRNRDLYDGELRQEEPDRGRALFACLSGPLVAQGRWVG